MTASLLETARRTADQRQLPTHSRTKTARPQPSLPRPGRCENLILHYMVCNPTRGDPGEGYSAGMSQPPPLPRMEERTRFPLLYCRIYYAASRTGQMMIVGYARVSIREQCFNGQLAELQARPHRAAEGDRPASAGRRARCHAPRPLGALHARSAQRPRFRQTGRRGLPLAQGHWATPHGQLMLTILGGLAEFQRTLIRARTAEGPERAKGAWGSLWSTKEALRAPASGGAGPDRSR
jgi:Resolvase, N terminal domain